jgi:hypothetical protein
MQLAMLTQVMQHVMTTRRLTIITMMALTSSIRPIMGWMSTQGLLMYYYNKVANAAKVMMNRCSYGNTAKEYNADNLVLYTIGGEFINGIH